MRIKYKKYRRKKKIPMMYIIIIFIIILIAMSISYAKFSSTLTINGRVLGRSTEEVQKNQVQG